MLDFIISMYEMLRTIWGFVQTVIWWIRHGIVFVFRLIAACFTFIGSLFTADLAFLVPFAVLSLFIGAALVILGRR